MPKQKRLPSLKAVFMTATVWILTACTTSTKPYAAADDFRLPEMPAQIAQPCEPLDEIADAKGKTVLRWAALTISRYQDCAARHDAAVRAYQSLTTPLNNLKGQKK